MPFVLSLWSIIPTKLFYCLDMYTMVPGSNDHVFFEPPV